VTQNATEIYFNDRASMGGVCLFVTFSGSVNSCLYFFWKLSKRAA